MKTGKHFKISREDEGLGAVLTPFCITLDLSPSFALPCRGYFSAQPIVPAPAAGFTGTHRHAPLKFCGPDSVSDRSLRFISLILRKLGVRSCFPSPCSSSSSCCCLAPSPLWLFPVLSAQGYPRSRTELAWGLSGMSRD